MLALSECRLTPADPLNATKLAYDLIYEHDGYHPVSLGEPISLAVRYFSADTLAVLNCENYFFEEYGLQGADIIMVGPTPPS